MEPLPESYHETHPFSYGGKTRVYEYYPNQSKKDIDSSLAWSATYTKFRPFRKLKQTSPIYVYYKRQLFQADLIEFDMAEQVEANDDYRYMLTVIDCFTKMVWLYKLKDKQTKTVIEQFRVLFQECDELPANLQTDLGKEFNSRAFAEFLENAGVNHYFAYGDRKVSIVERFNRTIQVLLYAMMDHHNTHEWTDLMDDARQIYISRRHSTIKMTPQAAELSENQSALLRTAQERYSKFKKKLPQLQVGDYVRMAGLKSRFTRGYLQHYSNEVFQVHAVLTNLPTPRYTLKDLDNEVIEDAPFWPNELVKFNWDENTEWDIEEVLDRRQHNGRREILVKWLGWPEKFNSWIPASRA